MMSDTSESSSAPTTTTTTSNAEIITTTPLCESKIDAGGFNELFTSAADDMVEAHRSSDSSFTNSSSSFEKISPGFENIHLATTKCTLCDQYCSKKRGSNVTRRCITCKRFAICQPCFDGNTGIISHQHDTATWLNNGSDESFSQVVPLSANLSVSPPNMEALDTLEEYLVGKRNSPERVSHLEPPFPSKVALVEKGRSHRNQNRNLGARETRYVHIAPRPDPLPSPPNISGLLCGGPPQEENRSGISPMLGTQAAVVDWSQPELKMRRYPKRKRVPSPKNREASPSPPPSKMRTSPSKAKRDSSKHSSSFEKGELTAIGDKSQPEPPESCISETVSPETSETCSSETLTIASTPCQHQPPTRSSPKRGNRRLSPLNVQKEKRQADLEAILDNPNKTAKEIDGIFEPGRFWANPPLPNLHGFTFPKKTVPYVSPADKKVAIRAKAMEAANREFRALMNADKQT